MRRREEFDREDSLVSKFEDDWFEDDLGDVPKEFLDSAGSYLEKVFKSMGTQVSPLEDLRQKLLQLSIVLDLMKTWEEMSPAAVSEFLSDRRTTSFSPKEEEELMEELEGYSEGTGDLGIYDELDREDPFIR